MPNPRLHRYAQALERLYEHAPADARVIDQYVADLRAECAQRRRQAREDAAASTPAPTAGPTRPGTTRPTRRTR